MIYQRTFTKIVETVNGEVTKENYTEQRFIFGIKFYEDTSEYSNELTKQKTGFK